LFHPGLVYKPASLQSFGLVNVYIGTLLVSLMYMDSLGDRERWLPHLLAYMCIYIYIYCIYIYYIENIYVIHIYIYIIYIHMFIHTHTHTHIGGAK